MQMIVMFGSARERTEQEFRVLLAESGLVLRRLVPTGSVVWLVEAVSA
jgi:hypothetical protein